MIGPKYIIVVAISTKNEIKVELTLRNLLILERLL